MSQLTPGWQTTEFRTTLAALLAGVLGLVIPSAAGTALPQEVQTAIVAVMGLVVFAYNLARGHAKAGAALADAIKNRPVAAPPGAPVPPSLP